MSIERAMGESSFVMPHAKVIVDFESLQGLNTQIADYFGEPTASPVSGIGINFANLQSATHSAVSQAERMSLKQEVEVRKAGYTDDEWLSTWRQTAYRHNLCQTIPETVRSSIFQGIIHFAVPSVVERQVNRQTRRDRIKLTGISALAATGAMSLMDGVGSPLEVALPILNTLGVFIIFDPGLNKVQRVNRVLRNMEADIQGQRPRVRHLLRDTVRVVPEIQDA